MPIFYWHPVNQISQKLREMTNQKGFLYTNRGELEFKLQNLLLQAGYDVYPSCHFVLGSLGGTIDKHLLQCPEAALNPDDELDRHTIKLCASSKTPWSYIKIFNGSHMMSVIGYCSTPATNPYSLSPAQMAQRGIIATSHVPS